MNEAQGAWRHQGEVGPVRPGRGLDVAGSGRACGPASQNYSSQKEQGMQTSLRGPVLGAIHDGTPQRTIGLRVRRDDCFNSCCSLLDEWFVLDFAKDGEILEGTAKHGLGRIDHLDASGEHVGKVYVNGVVGFPVDAILASHAVDLLAASF